MTSPVNASDTYKAQIRDIAFPSDNIELVYSMASLVTATANAGSRVTLRDTYAGDTLTLSASAVVTGSGTDWREQQRVRVDDIVQFGSDTRYYKVKSVDSDTQFTLYEAYLGTPAGPATIEWRTYYMDWVLFLIMPGQYVTPAAGFYVYPGQAFASLDKTCTRFSEADSVPATPFNNWGENQMYNMVLSPSEAYGTLDGAFDCVNYSTTASDYWAGQQSFVQGCLIEALSLRGEHAGGELRLPLLEFGSSYVRDCVIRTSDQSAFSSGTETLSPSDTRVVIEDSHFELRRDFTSTANFVLAPNCLTIGVGGRYDFSRCTFETPEDPQLQVFFGEMAGVRVPSSGVTGDIEINIDNCKINVANTNAGDVAYGIFAGSACDINISHCDIDVGGTTPVGVYTGNAGATVNLRHTRVKSPTTCIDGTTGTINYDAACTNVTGAVTNGTALDT